jgi:peroxiredoxin
VGEYEAPARFPALRLPALDGTETALAEAWARGPALVMVGHGDCDTTRFTLPYVERVHRGRANGGSVLAVLQDEPGEARAMAERLGLTLPVLLDRDPYPLGSALGLRMVPVVFLVEAGGRVDRVSEAFRRDDLEGFAARLGLSGPLFRAEDRAPGLRPG